MPTPTLLLDRLENAKFESTIAGLRVTRAWVAHNIDTSVPEQSLIRTLAISGMPVPGTLFPGFLFLRVTNYTAVPVSGTAAKGTVVYTGPLGDAIPLFIAERSSSLVQRQSQQFKDFSDTWQPIQAKLTLPGTTNPLIKTATVPAMRPAATVTLSRYQAPYPRGMPAFGSVNSNTMSGVLFDDAPGFGYWLFAGFDVKTLTLGANYDYRITLISLIDQDWSDMVYLRAPNGEPVVVPQALLQALLAADYTNIVTDATDTSGNFVGAARVGVYKLDDFTPFLTHNLTGL